MQARQNEIHCTDIRFKGYDPDKCDIDATDGEIAVSYGLSHTPSQGYTGTVTSRPVTRLPEGYRLLTLHSCRDGNVNILALNVTDSDTHVGWCGYDTDATEVDTRQIEDVGSIGRYISHTVIGDTVQIGTSEGLAYLYWRGGGYILLRGREATVTIEFGLQKAGHLAASDTIMTDADTARLIGALGSGASTMHPVTAEAKEQTLNIGERIAATYANADADQVQSKGYFDQPFFLQYALRLTDGSHVHISPPILMLPTVLPPLIGISAAAGSDGNTYISADLTANNYFALRYRITAMPGEPWRDMATAIDIYASTPIMTYQSDSIAGGYACTLRDVIDTADTGSAERGRHYPSRADDPDGIYAGHYSESNDNYTDHTVECTHAKIWMVSANPTLQDQLVQRPKAMYLISSIAISQADVMARFDMLPLLTAHSGQITTHPTLDTDAYTSQAAYSRIIPSAITTYGTQTVSAACSRQLASPVTLDISSAYSGNADSAGQETEIAAYSHHGGSVVKVSATVSVARAPLAEEFPRYLHYPDPDVFLVTLRQGVVTYTLPFTRDDMGTGAYWWGGLMTDCSPAAMAIPTAIEAETVSLGQTRLYVSAPDNPFVIGSTFSPGCHTATGFAPSVQAPYAGTFGQYPLYIFTSEGIMLLQYDDKTSTFTSGKTVSNEICANPRSICTAGDRVIFATDHAIMSIEGSKTTTLSQGITGMRFDISALPHAEQLLTPLNAKATSIDEERLYRECIVTYDKGTRTVVLSEKNGEFALVRSDDSDCWSIADLHIIGKSGDTLTDSDNNITRLAEHTQAHNGLLITRPMKMGTPISDKFICSVEILGGFSGSHVSVALYGSVNMSRWHVMGTAHGPLIAIDNRRPYRYIRICVISALEPGEWIYGAKIRWV